jgi:hypothetical protein
MGKKQVKAEEGMQIEYRNKPYTLAKEITPKCCKGCVFEHNNGCNDHLFQYCRQGFILKAVNK